MPIKLHYSIDTGQRKLIIKELPSIQHRFSEDIVPLTFVHRFLRMMPIRPTFSEEPGVTWLELLIAFEAHGGSLEPAVHERVKQDMARPMKTTRQLLHMFKTMVKFVLEICADPIDAILFRATNTNGTRLRALAIHHAVPSANFIPVWNNEVAYVITQGMLRQKCRMTKAYTTAHAAGTLELPWTNLNMKGAPSWRVVTAKGPTSMLRNESFANHHSPSSTSHNNNLELSHVFACPKCMCARDISRCSLLVKSGWGHILCLSCRITSRSMTWTCACGVPWHNCHVHSTLVRGEGEGGSASSSSGLPPPIAFP